MARPSSPIDITFAVTFDDLCTQIQEADDEGRPVRSVHVAPRVYEVVAAAKTKQHLSRGNPLLLLGLDLVRDEKVGPGLFQIR